MGKSRLMHLKAFKNIKSPFSPWKFPGAISANYRKN